MSHGAERGAPPSRPAPPPAGSRGPRRLASARDGAAVGSGRSGLRRLAAPRPTRVRADATGRPVAIGAHAVAAVRESWLIEDRWWTDAPLRRRYWEVVTVEGRNLVVFRDLERGGWYAQR